MLHKIEAARGRGHRLSSGFSRYVRIDPGQDLARDEDAAVVPASGAGSDPVQEEGPARGRTVQETFFSCLLRLGS